MENDKQIKNQLEQVKEIFLSDELLVKNAKPEVYSLPVEFANSKKNKSIFVFALLFLYIAAIGIGVYLITTIEENKSKSVDVNIAEFRQFNLLELLAEKKENEEKLAKLQQELADLRANGMKEIQKLSPKDQQKAVTELNEKMKKLEESYQQQITSKEQALISLEKSINAEKQKITKAVQESQNQVQNYQNLNRIQGAELVRLNSDYEAKIAKLTADHQAEIERLKKEHQTELEKVKKDNQALIDSIVLRYNPIFAQGEIATVVNSKIGSPNQGLNLNKFTKILPDEGVWKEQDYNQLRKKIQNQHLIINTMQQIPYTNSIPPAMDKLDWLSQSIINDYESLWGSLIDRLKEKDVTLNSYEYAVNYLSKTRHENGFVMDSRNPNQMLVFIDHIYSVKKGDVAFIIKNDDTPVAKIELVPERGRIMAKIKEILKPVKIEPFDKILLKLEVAQ